MSTCPPRVEQTAVTHLRGIDLREGVTPVYLDKGWLYIHAQTVTLQVDLAANPDAVLFTDGPSTTILHLHSTSILATIVFHSTFIPVLRTHPKEKSNTTSISPKRRRGKDKMYKETQY
ncbi:hypothetical protein EDD16DRAFT_1730110 [Pisolithus croceorrhizus]|nr:hypothetical protein EDD16DRAFT_1730110 [Pisolithus croceorrhizus]